MLDFAIMLDILVTNNSLQHIDASFTGLHGQGESKLHDALTRAKFLKSLNFSGISFGELQVFVYGLILFSAS
jgi:hypothetical protein